jgi:hypothetical protein
MHIVKQSRAWHLQDARGNSLGIYDDIERALVVAFSRANSHAEHGVGARVFVHRPGKATEIHTFDQ